MVDSGIRTRNLRLLNRGDPRSCILQDTTDGSGDLISARHGQFQDKEEKSADSCIEHFPFENNFSTAFV